MVTRINCIELIQDVQYWNNGKTTVCIFTLKTGFEVIGTSSVVDKSKFKIELGEQFSYEEALKKLMEYEAYKLHAEKQTK